MSRSRQSGRAARHGGPLWVALLGAGSLCTPALAQQQPQQPERAESPSEQAAESESRSELAEPAPIILDEYSARAEVAPPRPAARELELEAMRDVPGAFGDPFRVVDTLPGVVPVLSGLPYVYVRGAPPAGTIYVYDGIAVPALFHLALGPAVIHPALLGDLEFYPAVAPARFGRHVGGVFAAGGPDLDAGPLRGEFEIRLIDTQAMLDIPLGKTRLTVAGRYGYPGLLLSVFSEEAVLAYWDYQLRYRAPISDHDRFELTVFGAYDKVGEKRDSDDNVSLEFHRAELRLVRDLAAAEFGLGLQLGYEQSNLANEVAVDAARIGARIWSIFALGGRARARLGADMLAAVGHIDEPSPDPGDMSAPPTSLGDPGLAPTVDRPPNPFPDPSESEESEDGSSFDDPLYAAVAARNQAGLFAELELPLPADWTFAPGLRFDAFITGSEAQVALEPRVTLSWQALEPLQLHAAFGLGHQLAALPVPLPGFNDVALEHGLQEALRGELGVELRAGDLLVALELFYSHLSDLLLPLQFLDCEEGSDDEESCPDDGSLARSDVDAYGVEVFVKRELAAALSGWLSYTLAWAEGSIGDFEFTPEFDVRHVANAVLSYRIGGGFSAGSRLHYRTGKLESLTLAASSSSAESSAGPDAPLRVERRLPGFFRLDLQISYGWRPDWGKMRITLEWLNATMSREAIGLDCSVAEGSPRPSCEVDYTPAIFIPNLAMRAEF